MNDAALKDLLTADAPAARDFAFELAVMARIEQQQFRRALLRNVTVAVLAALVLAVVAAPLQMLWQQNIPAANSNLLLAALLLIATIFVPQLTTRRD